MARMILRLLQTVASSCTSTSLTLPCDLCYRPEEQLGASRIGTQRRTQLARLVRIALHSVNPEQRAMTVVDDLEEGLQHQPVWAQQRLFSILFSFFAALALILSLVGLASTLSFAIAQRQNELGIRMALGAQRSHIVWIVVRATLATVFSGTIVGLLLNFSLEKALRHWTPASVSDPPDLRNNHLPATRKTSSQTRSHTNSPLRVALWCDPR